MNAPSPRRRVPIAGSVWLLAIGHLLAFVDRAKVAGAMPAIRQQIAMSDAAAAWVIGTAFAVGYAATLLLVSLPSAGGAALGRSRMALGAALWAAASAATGLAETLPMLIALRVMLGVGQALFVPAALARIVADSDGSAARAAGMSLFTAGSSFGRSLGLLALGGALALATTLGAGAGSGWRWTFAVTVLPNIVLIAMLARLPARPSAPAVDPGVGGEPRRWLTLTYLALATLPIVVVQATVGWLPTLFQRDAHLSTGQASAWVGGLLLVGGPLGQIAGGWAMRHLGRWRLALPCFVAGAMIVPIPAFVLLALAPGRGWASGAAIFISVTLGIAAFAALYGWQDLVSDRRRVAGNSLFFAAITVAGVGLGPLLTGALADRGLPLGWALAATAAGGAILAILCAALVQPAYRRLAGIDGNAG